MGPVLTQPKISICSKSLLDLMHSVWAALSFIRTFAVVPGSHCELQPKAVGLSMGGSGLCHPQCKILGFVGHCAHCCGWRGHGGGQPCLWSSWAAGGVGMGTQRLHQKALKLLWCCTQGSALRVRRGRVAMAHVVAHGSGASCRQAQHKGLQEPSSSGTPTAPSHTLPSPSISSQCDDMLGNGAGVEVQSQE